MPDKKNLKQIISKRHKFIYNLLSIRFFLLIVTNIFIKFYEDSKNQKNNIYICRIYLHGRKMALIKPLHGIYPKIGPHCFLAETAVIIGDVEIGADCSIWYGAVLRGDVNPIRIGNRVNIQDGAVLHTLHKDSIVEVGDDVSIGHNAIIHGAKVGSKVLVGMGAILMDHAEISDNSIIGAGALVPPHKKLEPGVYTGAPAKKIRDASHEIAAAAHKNAGGYLMYKEWFLAPSNDSNATDS